MADTEKLFEQLRKMLGEIRQLDVADSLLSWDMETTMPENGAAARGKVLAFLSGESHDRMVSEKFGETVTALKAELDAGNLNELQAATVRRVWRDYRSEVCLPGDLVRESAEVKAAVRDAWAKGKKTRDSSACLKLFPRLVELKREEARLTAEPGQTVYDSAHGRFEMGMTFTQLHGVFKPLMEFLDGLMDRVAASGNAPKPLQIAAPIFMQETVVKAIVGQMGYDFASGRLDQAAHPFTSTIHPGDVRITTRYDPNNLLTAIAPTVHEAGHGMYEQGLPAELFDLPVGHVPSLGIHESQSRLWEKLVAQGRPFHDYLHRELACAGFPAAIDAEQLYRSRNIIEPNLIRVNSDEVTYNIHIYIRMMMEKLLMDGCMEVGELRDSWNHRMERMLGLDVPDDYAGFLQDVHWPSGYFGYFPTYTIGNLYSAQIYDAAKRDIPKLEDGFARGEFTPLLEWLRENIHSRAGLMPADEIIRQATGSGLTAANWMAHIERKYGEIYGF